MADIATNVLAANLRALAQKIRDGYYGPDTDFDEKAFLEDVEEIAVTMFDHEIVEL